MNKPLSYYSYETMQIIITWCGKVQPVGRFKSATEANTFINRHLIMSPAELDNYKIVTPDATLAAEWEPDKVFNPFATDKRSGSIQE